MIDRDPDPPDVESAGPFLVRVRAPSLEVFLEDFGVWMDDSGMLVRTGDLPSVDTPVRLDLRVGDDWKLIQGAGRVSWLRRETGSAEEPAGFGIEFESLSAQSRKLLRWIEEDRRASRAEGVEPKASPVPLSRLEIKPLDGTEPAVGKDGWKESSRAFKAVLAIGLVVVLGLLVGAGLFFFRSDDPDVGEARAPVGTEAEPEPKGEDLHRVVEAWAEAWETREAARHVSLYARTFVPPSRMSREEWEAWRTEQIEQSGDVRISVEVLEIEEVGDDSGLATFEQAYRTDTSEDLVVKELELVREDGHWLIVEERVAEPQ